jgi:hypothetical protein
VGYTPEFVNGEDKSFQRDKVIEICNHIITYCHDIIKDKSSTKHMGFDQYSNILSLVNDACLIAMNIIPDTDEDE